MDIFQLFKCKYKGINNLCIDLTEKYFRLSIHKSSHDEGGMSAEQLALWRSKLGTWEQVHVARGAFSVMFTFLSVALTGLVQSEPRCDSTRIRT